MYFQHKDLLAPPIKRAAYSDRTAWLLAEASRLAYLKFEEDTTELTQGLKKGGFTLVDTFNAQGTQAYLAKRESGSDKMAILAFRGTEQDRFEDIYADITFRFYKNKSGAWIHDGFYKAFHAVEADIKEKVKAVKEFALYITGHSLGGALALVAARALNSDNLAACYSFGSPRVGNEEFDDEIKPPIYRVVNAYDPVPFLPLSQVWNALSFLPLPKLQAWVANFQGYEHHGDLRYLVPSTDPKDVKVIPNYNDLSRLSAFFKNRNESIKHHDLMTYCEKLALYARKRKEVA